MKSLGVNIKINKNTLTAHGKKSLEVKNNVIDCNESGSTLRFLIPLATTTGIELTFKGTGKLVERPLEPYYKIFDEKEINYKNIDGKLPLSIAGNLKPGEYKVKGNISSQFISGLLFALPLLDGDSKIIVTTELESKPYVDLTIAMLKNFSVEVANNDYREFIVRGNQRYKAMNYKVEGDFSQAAFWLTAGILGANVLCDGLNINSLQGDKAVLEIIKSMGGNFAIEGDTIKALPSKTKATIIDASQCPDLVPILTVLAALSEGTTKIINAARLRIKESDRLSAIALELNKIGANIEEKEDGLVIRGKEALKGGTVHSWNDHRIAMALAIASIKCTEPLIIKDALCVKKSYPDFWKDFKKLGGIMDEWSLGEEA
jgi:3-phosphoshikimate 1-carboxyvinyltransferase